MNENISVPLDDYLAYFQLFAIVNNSIEDSLGLCSCRVELPDHKIGLCYRYIIFLLGSIHQFLFIECNEHQ